MKLLVDMNLSPRWVGFLHSGGFESEHWMTLGPPDAPDAAIMAFARGRGYVVLTHDLDFAAILAATQGGMPSVAQIRAENVSPEAIGRQVLAGLRQMIDELDQGALLTVEPSRTRMRVLPLLPD